MTLKSLTNLFTSLNWSAKTALGCWLIWVLCSFRGWVWFLLRHYCGHFWIFFPPDFAQYSKQQVVTQTKFLSRLDVQHDAAVLVIQSQTQTTVYCFVWRPHTQVRYWTTTSSLLHFKLLTRFHIGKVLKSKGAGNPK